MERHVDLVEIDYIDAIVDTAGEPLTVVDVQD